MNNYKLKQTGLSRTISALLLTGLVATTAQAGKIISELGPEYNPPYDSNFRAEGFGGWNLDNVEVVVDGTPRTDATPNGSFFDESDGSYNFAADSDYTYLGHVYDDVFGGADLMGYVLAKDWPVGEPSGIKIVNDDDDVKDPKPHNCIMATSYLADHFLDSDDPQQVTCSSDFQTHKRYKLAMLPASVDDGNKGIDLVFNVEPEAGSRDYQVFQKINNWTGGRLEGFTIQVGTGIGSEFTPASASDGVGVANLSLSVPGDIWDEEQLAVFSAGLFGPPDDKHDRDGGYYDPLQRAGFKITQYGGDGDSSGQTDTLTSGATLGSNYADVPAGATNQFGPWLSSNMLPQGVFFDDDGNPETDAELLAWYGCNPALDLVDGKCALGWMSGSQGSDENETPFSAISDDTIEGMGSNLAFTQGEIDDLVNVGLNYIVTVGDVTDFSGAFTIRITPTAESPATPAPDYVGVTPVPSLQFLSKEGVVEISPSPDFVVGELLTLRVGDANVEWPVEVDVTSNTVNEYCVITGTEGTTETVILIDQSEEDAPPRGVYAATTDAFTEVAVGTIVTVVYHDTDIDGESNEAIVCAQTKAVEEPVEVLSDVSITTFTATESLFVGRTAKLSVTIQNAKEAEGDATGTVQIIGTYEGDDEASVFIPVDADEFSGLSPNKKLKFSYKWSPLAAGVVNWVATVDVEGADPVTADGPSTDVSVKPGKNNNNGNK